MRIVINHLTRMQPGYICVAGINLDTGRHVRPVIRGRLPRKLLSEEGSLFEIGAIVELGSVNYVGRPPETEDFLFDPANAQVIEKLSHEQFWDVISRSAQSSLTEIFGDDLQQQGHGFTISVNRGNRSLGCLRIIEPPALTMPNFEGKTKLRICIVDAGTEVWLSVTDIRFYERDQATLRHDDIQRIAQLLEQKEEAILCVGFARAWKKPGDAEARHWLQLNNIHLRNHPF